MIDIASNNLVACICEGSSEKTIMSALLNNGLLRFSKEQLLSGELLGKKYRNSMYFQNDFLTLDYEGREIVILVVQDRALPYVIKSPYSKKIKGIHSLLTKPEIEMLMIHAGGERAAYEKVKSSKKPSLFLQEKHKIKGVELKSKKYIDKFYETHSLVDAINEHKRVTKAEKDHYFLADILK